MPRTAVAGRIEADAVVLDDEHDLPSRAASTTSTRLACACLDDVVERLLGDAVERHLGVARELAGLEPAEAELRRDADVRRPLGDEARQRRRQAELVERGRTQLPGEEVDVAADLLRQRERPGDLVAAGVGAAAALLAALERQAQRRQLLPEMVVQVAGDARALVLLRC